jgi:lipooligosaccharide transport system ATP-binding protein
MPDASSSILLATALTKKYSGELVVNGIDLNVRAGECFGLLGPNGAGKTTTLRMCLGLIAPDSGSIMVGGLPVPSRAREARMRVGVVPQMDNLDPDFTVEENLLVYGRYFGLSHRDIVGRMDELLDFASLMPRRHAKIGELSGGMKRRLTLARALVNDPDLLFLDEPTTGLDPQARHLIWERLKLLLARGKTIVLTTHFMDEAERLCDRLAVMDHGRIITQGSPRALISANIEPEVVEVFGEAALRWQQSAGELGAVRVERMGETLFLYTNSAGAITASLANAGAGVRYMHRAANLEDVFLKLTGRELRE